MVNTHQKDQNFKNTQSGKEEKKSKLENQRSNIFIRELIKDEWYVKLGGVKRETREKIAQILSDRTLFGEIIEKREISKIQSLINELQRPGSSVDPKIREIANKIRNELGNSKDKVRRFIDNFKEAFGL